MKGTFDALNKTGNDIIRQSASPSADALQTKLSDVNTRWAQVTTEISDGQDRY